MEGKKAEPFVEKLFTWKIVLLGVVGLSLNLVLSRMAMLFGLPLYMDTAGTILVGALGGAFPGMVVGFLSNVIRALANQTSLYFGILAVVTAWLSALFSGRGMLKKWWGVLLAAGLLAVIDGGIGSVMTWLLNGGEIGGIAEPYALMMYRRGIAPFWSQLTADILVDITDKLISVGGVCILLHFMPQMLGNSFPLSYQYSRDEQRILETRKKVKEQYRKVSVCKRIIKIMSGAMALVSIMSLVICMYYFNGSLKESYAGMVSSVSAIAADIVDGDSVERYLELGTDAIGYDTTKDRLISLKEKNPYITYLFVYKVEEDGCHVVFDLDTPKLKGEEPGTVLTKAQGISEHLDNLLHGGEVSPEFSYGAYGWLMTGYAPVYDSVGNTTAYVGADILMEQYLKDMLIYLIRIISVIFGMMILIIAFVIWYVRNKITNPITAIIAQSRAFDQEKPQEWLHSDAWMNRMQVTTGDEIEELYQTVCRGEQNVSQYVTRLIETEEELGQTRELERVNAELAEAIKRADAANTAKSEFYSRMSHDMRTPMNGIIGLVELSEDEDRIQVLRDNVKKIGHASQYLLGLINDTLDVNKMESNKLTLHEEPVLLRRFVNNVADMIRPSLSYKGIPLHLDIRGILLDTEIMVDEMRLKQIFMNLISNAIKFTPKGGEIHVAIEQYRQEEGCVHCMAVIRDTGYGMSSEYLEHGIFKPFSQERNKVTSEYAGSGLGLAIVKNLIDLMGGRIEVQSQPGKGTTFTLWIDARIAGMQAADSGSGSTGLPIDVQGGQEGIDARQGGQERIAAEHGQENSGAAQKPAVAETDLSVLQGKRVLLCEDHPLNTEIAVRLLERAGMHVETAGDGAVGAAMYELTELNYYDVVLMDIRMPVMDGLEATGKIRSMKRADAVQIPIIAMTANAFAEDKEKSRAAGMNAHIAKPIDAQLLYRTLAEFLKGHN